MKKTIINPIIKEIKSECNIHGMKQFLKDIEENVCTNQDTLLWYLFERYGRHTKILLRAIFYELRHVERNADRIIDLLHELTKEYAYPHLIRFAHSDENPYIILG